MIGVGGVGRQAVGDALSGVLLVEGALQLAGLDMASWAGLYQDLPSRMLKVTRTLLRAHCHIELTGHCV